MAPFNQAPRETNPYLLNTLPLLSSEKRPLPAKLRVYNRSREGFLSLEVIVVDTTAVSLKSLIEDLATKVNTALWFTPYRGLPASYGVPPFDVIYLSEQHRILQDVETYPNPNVQFLKFEPVSALVLPVHTVFGSRSRSGDQLEFRDASEPIEHGFKLISRSVDAQTMSSQKPDLRPDPARTLQLAINRLDPPAAPEARPPKKDTWARLMGWLIPDLSERRHAGRHPLPGLVAYHWTGATPQAYHIGNISETGFFLLTDERPFPGTIILMTLQRIGSSGQESGDSVAIHARVVRWGPDGVGLELLPVSSTDHNGNPEDEHKAFKHFYKRLDLPRSE
ncbi:MAG TPA: PilZ domain-containing protein [Terracidiphilus sp.]|nr:PilZ domain-containing protein [Terracidiphilus sp.]